MAVVEGRLEEFTQRLSDDEANAERRTAVERCAMTLVVKNIEQWYQLVPIIPGFCVSTTVPSEGTFSFSSPERKGTPRVFLLLKRSGPLRHIIASR